MSIHYVIIQFNLPLSQTSLLTILYHLYKSSTVYSLLILPLTSAFATIPLRTNYLILPHFPFNISSSSGLYEEIFLYILVQISSFSKAILFFAVYLYQRFKGSFCPFPWSQNSCLISKQWDIMNDLTDLFFIFHLILLQNKFFFVYLLLVYSVINVFYSPPQAYSWLMTYFQMSVLFSYG